MTAICWQYLLGRARAADFANRRTPEWPPHPDRVFQALVAAWAERGYRSDERKALEWLEALPAPGIAAPEVDMPEESPRVFVPMNDAEASAPARKRGAYPSTLLTLLPEKRTRKVRHFPEVWVGDEVTALVWRDAEVGDHKTALSRLCAEVTRIGHSSSFVRCWLEDSARPVRFAPAEGRRPGRRMLRAPNAGRLEELASSFDAAKELGRYRGTPKAREISYTTAAPPQRRPSSNFSSDMVVLELVDRRPVDLVDTLALTAALRGALIRAAGDVSERARELISGHRDDGNALEENHVGYVPLPFVGSPYADGHVLGLGLALPVELSAEEEQAVYDTIGSAMDEEGFLHISLSRGRRLKLQQAELLPLKRSLQVRTWTESSSHWASVTPVVMDRMQNRRRSDPDGWAREQVEGMCRRVGLPTPAEIVLRPASILKGGRSVGEFPPLERKDGSSRRMVHVRLRFAQEVSGPIMIGSGRFRGYGFCKPVNPGET